MAFVLLNRHNNIFKDVYREFGILEVFVGCLMKYNGFLQKQIDVESDPYDVQLTTEDEIDKGKYLAFFLKNFIHKIHIPIDLTLIFFSMNRRSARDFR